MASVLTTISIVALALALVFLIAAAVIFVRLKIWIVMADLSGKTAQQSIERLRSQNGKPAPRKQHRAYVVNSGVLKRSRGTAEIKSKKTEPIANRGKPTEKMMADDSTTVLTPEEVEPETLGSDGTSILREETSILCENGTVVLETEASTTVLQEGTVVLGEGTTVLSGATTVIQQTAANDAQATGNFVIVTDIVMIHTDEFILQQNDFHEARN